MRRPFLGCEGDTQQKHDGSMKEAHPRKVGPGAGGRDDAYHDEQISTSSLLTSWTQCTDQSPD